jgi:spore maturation protein CgeB
MGQDHLESNLVARRARAATRAAAVATAEPLAGLVPTPGGVPTIEADGVLLHNRQDPVREAERWAAQARERAGGAPTAVVLGFGLGYHVEALARVFDGRIVVVEPDGRVLRTALATRDLRALLGRIELAPEPVGRDAMAGFGACAVLPHAPSLLRAGDALRTLGDRIAARGALGDLRLRVLVISPLLGGSHPITFHCARALADLGHVVTVLDLAAFAGGLGALGSFTPKRAARRIVEEAWGRFLGTGVLAAVDAAKPDVVLAMAQAPLDATVLQEIGKRGIVRAFWFVEDHRLFPYWRHVIGEYDHFFAIQQGDFLAEAARATAGRVTYLPCAADADLFRPLALTAAERAEYEAPVSFVGAGYRNRRIAFRSLLDLGLRIWGTEWAGAGQVEGVVQRDGRRIPPSDAVRIFNATAVNVNLHSSTYVDGVDPRGDFVNPRTFELAACGAFQLVDRRALLPPLLADGRELVGFDDAGELRGLVEDWLARPEERAAIGGAARARVLAEHRYHARREGIL